MAEAMTRLRGGAVGAFLVAAPFAAHAQISAPAHVPALMMAQTDDAGSDARSSAHPTQMPAALQAQARASQNSAEASASSSPVTPDRTPHVPDAVPASVPPPIRFLSPSAPLNPKERHGTGLARRWRNRAEMPQPGEDGVVRFLYGATMPSVVCAPLMVCDLALQPGEVVQNLNVGDSVRWKISPALSGTGEGRTTHVIIKPVDAGLVTNMILSTTLRVYSIRLVSTQHEWMPLVAFNYPDDVKAEWSAYQRAASGGSGGSFGSSSRPSTGSPADNLDFDYRISGDSPDWKPVRVFDDGAKMYIEFSSAMDHKSAPALVALADDGGLFKDPTPQVVNYRSIGNRYEVDSLLPRTALISGVGGDQIKVTITHIRRGGHGS